MDVLLTVLCLCLQFAYVLLVGSFPFNSFLAGLLSCVGFFVLTGTGICLLLAVTQDECLAALQELQQVSVCSVFANASGPSQQGLQEHVSRACIC